MQELEAEVQSILPIRALVEITYRSVGSLEGVGSSYATRTLVLCPQQCYRV